MQQSRSSASPRPSNRRGQRPLIHAGSSVRDEATAFRIPMSVIWGKIGRGSERGAMSAIDPLTDIQIVAHGDFGDLGILRVSWPFSRIVAIKAISAAALGLILVQ